MPEGDITMLKEAFTHLYVSDSKYPSDEIDES